MHSHLQKPTIIRQQPVRGGVRSAVGRCVAATPNNAPADNPLFNACSDGTAKKNDGVTPIGKPVVSFKFGFPGAGYLPGTATGGIVGVCCADYTDVKNTIAAARDIVQPIVCNVDTLKNLVPEKITFPFNVGQKVPIAFPMRKYICPPPNEPPFVPPASPAELPPYSEMMYMRR